MRSHASPRLTQSDHTLELLDEQGAVAGAQDGSRWISIEVSGVAAMHLLLQSVRGPLAPPPSLAERPAHGGGGGGGGELLLRCAASCRCGPRRAADQSHLAGV
eukprot:scaffold46862_cov50-Phaeocystis_antarctica.AAC.3